MTTAVQPAIRRASRVGCAAGFGAERVGEHRQPIADDGGIVVDDVVDAGRAVFARQHARRDRVVEWMDDDTQPPSPTTGMRLDAWPIPDGA
jgi:hypothetical protein